MLNIIESYWYQYMFFLWYHAPARARALLRYLRARYVGPRARARACLGGILKVRLKSCNVLVNALNGVYYAYRMQIRT